MSTNPYQAPLEQNYGAIAGGREAATRAVAGPAISLMVVSGICVAMLTLSIPVDIYLLTSGAAAQLEREPLGAHVTILIRLIWGCCILGASGYVFWGAVQMKELTSYRHARAAAIVACIPCLGPCCILGIPFGAWGLGVLGRSEVRASFQR